MRLSCLVSVWPVWLSLCHITAAHSVNQSAVLCSYLFYHHQLLFNYPHLCDSHATYKNSPQITNLPSHFQGPPFLWTVCVCDLTICMITIIPHIFYTLLVVCLIWQTMHFIRYFIPLPEACCAAAMIVTITDPNSGSEMMYSCFYWNHQTFPANMDPCSDLSWWGLTYCCILRMLSCFGAPDINCGYG